ncbi:MAG: hypothetical protein EOO53_14475 [Gammaproteobacteria bacterium]|nr:MAG: hypothetical protein EOO53_14475 [Gammaproteobacteria bacterium]
MINLYFVEAPFQLISAQEVAKTVSDKNILIIRKNGHARNEEQLDLILAKSKAQWTRVIQLKINRNSSFIHLLFSLNVFYLFYLKIITLFERGGINIVAIGDYRSGLWRRLYPLFFGKALWFLDDGIALINLYHKKNNNLVFDETLLEHESMGTSRYFIENSSQNSKVIFKTFMNIEAPDPFTVENISLTSAFQSEKNKHQTIDNSLVYFVGSKAVDDGILSEADYLEICERGYKQFSDKKVVYFPHREESQAMIDKIKDRFNFDIVRPILPLEFHICQQDIVPSYIAGISSTALCTIAEIYPHIKIYLIDFDRKNLTHDMRISFDACHEYIIKLREVSVMDWPA